MEWSDEVVDGVDEGTAKLLAGRRFLQFAPIRNRLESRPEHAAEVLLQYADDSFAAADVQRPHQHVLHRIASLILFVKISTTTHADRQVSRTMQDASDECPYSSPNKLCGCGRPPHYAPPSLQVDLWPFDLESGVRVTCDVGYLCANFSLPRPLCSRLKPDVRDRQTDDRQTDVRRASSLNAPIIEAGA